MKKKQNILCFMEKFGTEELCFRHLCELKWGAGFACRRCSHTLAVRVDKWHHRRCQQCGYNESCTAHTLFHKLKFPVVNAFLIVHQLSTMKKGMSTLEISRQHGIHQETAWFFKRKVQQAMGQAEQALLSGIVQVDETVIGGFEKGAVGRSRGKRQKVEMAVEIEVTKDGGMRVKSGMAKVIDNYSSVELQTAIDSMIDKAAIVVTDQ